jgi:N-acetylmuramoyl-L-alanine amidase
VSAGPSAQPHRRWAGLIVATLAWLAVLTAAAVCAAQPLSSPLPNEQSPVIVLDPGHGGADQGSRGPSGLLEKDITLQVATEAGRLIEQLLGLRVVLMRSDDSEMALEDRAALANEAGADLFISIHTGGSFAPTRREFQVFYFDDLQRSSPPERGQASDRDLRGQGGQDPRGVSVPSPPVLWDQAQLDFLDMSQMFARLLYRNLRAQVGEEGRGVFGLPILLLRWVRMPAVLLDLGSLSDPDFEAKLRDEAYLQRAALGIAQAIDDYQALRR